VRTEILSTLAIGPHSGPYDAVEGEKIGAGIRPIEFQADPTPVTSATITDYKP